MSRVRLLVSFASWTYGSQLITVILQFGYAAITSRLVDDVGFGAYAVALSASALVSLLTTGGLGQTIARMQFLSSAQVSALAAYALGLGAVAASVLFLSAEFWAKAWETPAAVVPIQVLSVSAFIAPLGGLLNGLLRRQQRFRLLAMIVILSNGIGMGVGVVGVILAPGPTTLLISPITALVLLTTLSLIATRATVFARPEFHSINHHLRFSWAVTGLSLISYVNGNVGRLAVSRGVGVEALGQWNRADVLTAVPLQQVHGAMQQAIYPEFRHDIGDNERTHRVWTDLLVLLAWVAFPLSALVGVLATVAVPVLFGSGWGLAAQLAFPIALIVAVQMVSTTLNSALEAVGRFRMVMFSHLVSLSIQVVGAVATLLLQNWLPVLIALAVSSVSSHAIQIVLCSTRRYLLVKQLLCGYVGAGLIAALLAACGWGILLGARGELPIYIAVLSLSVLLVGGIVSWRMRSLLPPIKILEHYRG